MGLIPGSSGELEIYRVRKYANYYFERFERGREHRPVVGTFRVFIQLPLPLPDNALILQKRLKSESRVE